jgi:hypothetical protein
MTQSTFLPKMGAPLRKITAKQIEDERTLWLATNYNISHRAKMLGVKRSTLNYHLLPVMPSKPRLSIKIQNLIEAADALRDAAPKNEQGFYLRQAYAAARLAVARSTK